MHGNFEVDIASSIEAGREKIKTKTYEAIVSDCALPRKESLELAKELREHGSNIPFILFTTTARALGSQGWLVGVNFNSSLCSRRVEELTDGPRS